MPQASNLSEAMKTLNITPPLAPALPKSTGKSKDWFRFDKTDTPDERNPENVEEFSGHLAEFRSKITSIAKEMASAIDTATAPEKDNDTVAFPVDISETEGDTSSRTFRFRVIKVYKKLRSDGGYIEKNGSNSFKSNFYELRVPRFESGAVSSNIATHRVLKRLISHTIPIPNLVYFGDSKGSLSHSFMISDGVEGIPIIAALQQHRVGRKGRFSIAKQMASIYVAMDNHKTLVPGKIDSAASPTHPALSIMDANTSAVNGTVSTYPGYELFEYFPWYSPSSRRELPATIMSSSVLEYLTTRLQNFSAACTSVDGIITKRHLRSFYSKLIYILNFIDARTSVFASNPNYHLIHGNLNIQNILVLPVDPNHERGEWKVTAILDWDTAHFGPRVCLWKPPTWLWKDIGSFEGLTDYVFHRIWAEEECSTYPMSHEGQQRPMSNLPLLGSNIVLPDDPMEYLSEVRKVFEEEMKGHKVRDYEMLAYHPLCQLARRVVAVAMDGVTVGSERQETNLKAMEELIAMWNRINESEILPRDERGMRLEVDWI
ncbi:hypothetical protein BJ508DRAFT_413077 [Ascobolus immersus RN42]|uniref:Uncharacterized protein n=1 Tax=Ascobolus immersus RN42 TaxID=1160509 RepID=A0A3N4IE51_ASCIM|nr:hypothetical protein BJ508DRAFT_413077 [Ascobolus immersus RN42]